MISRLARTVVAAAALGGCATIDPPTTAASFALVFDQVLVETYFGNRGPYTCIVDTGSSTAVDRRLARELGWKEGAANRVPVAFAGGTPDAIEVGEKDLAPVSREIARPVHCVLGQNWLALRVVEIDYPRRLLSLAPSSPRPLCREFPMRFARPGDQQPVVDAQVNGQVLPLALETGDDHVLRLAPEGSRRAAVESMGAGGKPDRMKGAVDTGRGLVRNLELGPLAMSNVSVAVREPAAGTAGLHMGSLGNGFFKAGVLTLDYPAKRVRVCAART